MTIKIKNYVTFFINSKILCGELICSNTAISPQKAHFRSLYPTIAPLAA
jgi:hypothetical protein